MILADTSIWIDHLRSGNRRLAELLHAGLMVTHPYVVGEVALGNLPLRPEVLRYLDGLPGLRVARQDEVRSMVESRTLYGQGIGWVDAHLLASCLIHPSTTLWTADKRLRVAAGMLGVEAMFS